MGKHRIDLGTHTHICSQNNYEPTASFRLADVSSTHSQLTSEKIVLFVQAPIKFLTHCTSGITRYQMVQKQSTV